MPNASDVALSHLKKVLAREPMLRDVLAEALPAMGRAGGFSPDVDVFETDEAHVVVADVPGVRREAVTVRLEGARLVIEGERGGRVGDDATQVRSSERATGRFRREFLLPPEIDAEGVAADLAHGVLTVTVPKKDGGRRDVPIGGEG